MRLRGHTETNSAGDQSVNRQVVLLHPDSRNVVAIHSTMAGVFFDCGLRIAECGMRNADCGLRIVVCGLRIVAWSQALKVGWAQKNTKWVEVRLEGVGWRREAVPTCKVKRELLWVAGKRKGRFAAVALMAVCLHLGFCF